jgi:hypothetical protein
VQDTFRCPFHIIVDPDDLDGIDLLRGIEQYVSCPPVAVLWLPTEPVFRKWMSAASRCQGL